MNDKGKCLEKKCNYVQAFKGRTCTVCVDPRFIDTAWLADRSYGRVKRDKKTSRSLNLGPFACKTELIKEHIIITDMRISFYRL